MVIGWRFISLVLLTYCVMGAAVYEQTSYELSTEIPQIEEEESSLEEQEMLDMFHAQEQTLFWQWMYKVGGSIVARYMVIKEAMKKKYGTFRDWLIQNKKREQKKVLVRK